MHALVLSVTDVNVAMTKSLPPLLMLNVAGTVPTAGWTTPEIVPSVYLIEPPDGIWDFHFMATPPNGLVSQVISSIEASLTVPLPKWCVGVRVHSANNKVEEHFSDANRMSDNLVLGLATTGASRDDPGDTWPWVISDKAMRLANEIKQSLLERPENRNRSELVVDELVGRKLRVLKKGQPGDLMMHPNRVTFMLDEEGKIENWLPF